MVDRTFSWIFCVFLYFSTFSSVTAYYCDNDKCDFDEYCCGHNICCTSYNVWQMWYFWLGLVLFLILLAGCFSFWRYRYQQAVVVQACSHPTAAGYNPLSNPISSSSSQRSIPSNFPSYNLPFESQAPGFSYSSNLSGKNGLASQPNSVVYT